jgi:hypothetical protein
MAERLSSDLVEVYYRHATEDTIERVYLPHDKLIDIGVVVEVKDKGAYLTRYKITIQNGKLRIMMDGNMLVQPVSTNVIEIREEI